MSQSSAESLLSPRSPAASALTMTMFMQPEHSNSLGNVHGGVILNAGEASILFRGEKTPLTRNELRILQTLMENAGKFVSRDRLMLQLWESDSFCSDDPVVQRVVVGSASVRKELDRLQTVTELHDRRREEQFLNRAM